MIPESRCATRNFTGQGEMVVEQEHFDKHFVKNTRKTGHRETFWSFSLPDTFKTAYYKTRNTGTRNYGTQSTGGTPQHWRDTGTLAEDTTEYWQNNRNIWKAVTDLCAKQIVFMCSFISFCAFFIRLCALLIWLCALFILVMCSFHSVM